mmetsp:Transcript_27692/g.95813  ORF Transcript_27692/g.95813 Transcript_27692/m.95813 type:complete len:244 (-) Transcript_27692:1009-1740(-)
MLLAKRAAARRLLRRGSLTRSSPASVRKKTGNTPCLRMSSTQMSGSNDENMMERAPALRNTTSSVASTSALRLRHVSRSSTIFSSLGYLTSMLKPQLTGTRSNTSASVVYASDSDEPARAASCCSSSWRLRSRPSAASDRAAFLLPARFASASASPVPPPAPPDAASELSESTPLPALTPEAARCTLDVDDDRCRPLGTSTSPLALPFRAAAAPAPSVALSRRSCADEMCESGSLSPPGSLTR